MELYYWAGLVYFMFGARQVFSLSILFSNHKDKFTEKQIKARHYAYLIVLVFWPVFIGRFKC